MDRMCSMPLSIGAVMLLALLLPFCSGTGTRALGEELYFNVTFDMDDPFNYSVSALIEVGVIKVEDDLLTADQLRDLYTSNPDATLANIEGELTERLRDRVLDAVEGATVTLKGIEIATASLVDDPENAGDPVTGTASLAVRVDPSDYIPSDYLSGIGQGRLLFLLSGLMEMGFRFSETYRFTAQPGESFIYRIPSHLDPMGDGSIDLVVDIPGEATPPSYHVVSLSGTDGTVSERHTFRMRAYVPITASEESVEGTVAIDLPDLSEASISASANISSIDLMGTGITGDLPPGVEGPGFLRSGAVRYLVLEGALDDSDLEVVRDEISEDAKDRITESLESEPDLEVGLDLSLGGLDPPSGGAALKGLLSSGKPILLSMASKSPTPLNLTAGHDPEDVLSLVHGGVVLNHEFERMDDERFEMRLVLPQGLLFVGRDPIENGSGRRTYIMPWGLVGIASDRAPHLSGENVRVRGDVHMDDLRSIYLVDSVISASAELTLELGWILYDPSITGDDDQLDYDVEYLTSDILRLALDMGLINESDIEDRISRSISRFLEDALGEPLVDIEFDEGTFDSSDLGEIDGSDPIVAHITVESEMNPMGDGGSEGSTSSKAYIPKHIDPLLPIKKYEKTVPLGDCSEWDLELNVTFPPGCGVKGWMGREGDEHATALQTAVVDGCPTLRVVSGAGENEALYLELSGGLYLAFDNVTVCFFGTWVFLAIILIVIVWAVVSKIRKKARKQRTVKPKVGPKDLDPNDLWGEKDKAKGTAGPPPASSVRR